MKEIKLTQGKAAFVDDVDFPLVNQFKWCARYARNERFYAIRVVITNGKKITKYMHRFILGERINGCVDHINGNGLDNRRSNLRQATYSQNLVNSEKRMGCTSKFKGVYWDKYKNKWRAQTQAYGKRIRLGHFSDEIMAAQAYDRAAIKHFGEFARLNFPQNLHNQEYRKNFLPSIHQLGTFTDGGISVDPGCKHGK